MRSNGVLESASHQATKKLAEKGVEGCTTKEVILAVFAPMFNNGGLAKSEDVNSILIVVKKFCISTVSVCITTLLAMIVALILL